MIEQLKISEKPKKVLSMHPIKFALWLFIVSITMIFASLTSAYIVKRSAGEWLVFDLPQIFWITSGIIILSSVTMIWAYRSAIKNELAQNRAALLITLGLGIMFLAGQWLGWGALVENNVYFVGNPAGSFVYVITGVHGLHLISGIVFLVIVLVKSYQYRVHSKNLTLIQMCSTYWHFLGLLWIYLFVFLEVFN